MSFRRSSFPLFSVSLSVIAALIQTPIVSFAAPSDRSLTETQRVQQVISRLTFGARPGDLERISGIGVDAYIKQQLEPEAIDDSALDKRLAKLPTLGLSTPALAEQYNPPKPPPTPTPTASPSPGSDMKSADMSMASQAPAPAANATPTPKPSPTLAPKNPGMVVAELQRAKVMRAVYSERQLYEVTVDFWENHFSIYANKDADRWMMTSFDRDSVRPFALGRFRDLLGSVAHSPAMLFYLDNWQSSVLKEYPATKDKPARTSGGINENYARELMELHTLGVDGGYTQKDVQEVARCLTGWTIRKPQTDGIAFYNPAMHDNGEKNVLGVKIPAGGGIRDGEMVLDILARHPSTARFISTKLARRFFSDNPPPAIIERAAKVFLTTDGSISETLKSIITSKEFFSQAAFETKVKTPFEYVVAALRATRADTDGGGVLDWLKRMGQPVYGKVTPDGYPDMASEWLSNNDLLTRLNFATALTLNNVRGTKVSVATLLPLSTTSPSEMPRMLIDNLLWGRASQSTLQQLQKLAAEPPPQSQVATSSPGAAQFVPAVATPEDPRKAVAAQLIALALGSPEFQRR